MKSVWRFLIQWNFTSGRRCRSIAHLGWVQRVIRGSGAPNAQVSEVHQLSPKPFEPCTRPKSESILKLEKKNTKTLHWVTSCSAHPLFLLLSGCVYCMSNICLRGQHRVSIYFAPAVYVKQLELNSPALYALHVLATVALLLRGLAIAGRLLHMGQHVGHQRLLQPLPHAVHQLLLLPAHRT